MSYPHDRYGALPPWYPFVPPFDPPGSEPGYTSPVDSSSADDNSSEGAEASDGSSADDDEDETRPEWWPDTLPWPPEPEGSGDVEAPPPRNTWPRLPPDHPYHLPEGYWYPDNLPPGHPGIPGPKPPPGSESPDDGSYGLA